MKNISLKVFIITTVLMLIAGLMMGKFLFQGKAGSENMDEHQHAPTQDAPASTQEAEQIWTCSMHPQIRQNEPGLCPICGMDLIPLDNQVSNQDPTILQMSPEAAKLAQISTYTVGGAETETMAHEIKVDGTVELDERLTNSQTSHLAGRIEQLYVNFTGEYVSKGSKIATLYSPELLTASKELITAAKFDDEIKGVKDAAIRKLKNWKISDQQIADILSSGMEIETVDIYADHNGYVLNKKLSQGDYVRQGGVIYTIGQISRVWLFFNVFESDLQAVKRGGKIKFQAPAIPGKTFHANITYIDPVLNPTSRTIKVRAELVNSGQLLKPGMLLKGTIISNAGSSQKDQLSVPKSAVLWTGKTSVVYVQIQDMEIPSFRFREITLGKSLGSYYEVEKGLDPGEVVVTNGAFVIDAAAQLSNQKSMMNRDVTIKQTGMDGHPDFKGVTPNAFRVQLESVVDAYLEVKDAFVATDPDGSKTKTTEMLKALDQVDMTLIKDEAHIYWMGEEKTIRTHGEKLQKESDIEEQRKQFDFLSQGIINAVKAFGVAEESVFIQFCPMALNSKGAEWVSTEQVIKNPYFGDKMLKCGSVLDSVTVAMNASSNAASPNVRPMGHNH